MNSVNGILKLPPLSFIESTPDMIKSKINSEYLTGVGKAGNRLLILLNLARVLGEEEVDELNQLSSSSSSFSSSSSSPSLSSSSSPSSSYSSSSPSSSFKESPEENT